MDRNRQKASAGHRHLVPALAAGGLLLLGLFALVSGASRAVRADPGTLFVRPDGSGTLCTQAQPCDLQAALARASFGDAIYLAGGTYTGSGDAVVTLTNGVNLYGGWDGTTAMPVVRDPIACPTTLDGQGQRRGVYAGIGVAATLDGLIVTRGRSGYSGGGIAADLASLTIRGCQIVGNTAPGDGGGIFINGGAAQILNSRVLSNTATWAGGLRIINDTNTAIVGNEIRDNVALISGGGIEVDCCGGTAPLIARNWIVGNDGGGRGGGVQVRETNAGLVNNILASNRAIAGAGLGLEGMASYPANVTLTHNTLVGGPSGGDGVGVGPHVTIALVNNILVGFTAGITEAALASSTISADHNLFWNASDPLTGTNALLADPLLDAAYHLTGGSPARDAGDVVNVTTDLDGDPRPVSGYDIGADEIALRCYLPIALQQAGTR
jgi:hypothetical protein